MWSRNCEDLPIHNIGPISDHVFAAYTGPEGGLTAVNRKQRHIVADEDVEFIDSEEKPETSVIAEKPKDLISQMKSNKPVLKKATSPISCNRGNIGSPVEEFPNDIYSSSAPASVQQETVEIPHSLSGNIPQPMDIKPDNENDEKGKDNQYTLEDRIQGGLKRFFIFQPPPSC